MSNKENIEDPLDDTPSEGFMPTGASVLPKAAHSCLFNFPGLCPDLKNVKLNNFSLADTENIIPHHRQHLPFASNLSLSLVCIGDA